MSAQFAGEIPVFAKSTLSSSGGCLPLPLIPPDSTAVKSALRAAICFTPPAKSSRGM